MMISRVETGLAQLLAERLGLARKAGVVGFGTAGIEQALITCAPTDLLVLMARNTAIHTREKVRRLVKKHGLPHVMEILDRDTIGAACGRGPTAVLAVAGQTVALPIIQVATRWQTFVESEFPCTRAVGVPKPAEKIS
jgi:D-arabinose 1-dehydrogenase-like Zn-dependent alcohol dehydrogenase